MTRSKADAGYRGKVVGARVAGGLVLILMLSALLAACGGNEGGGGGGGDNADRGSGGGGGGGGGTKEEPPITELSEIASASDRAALAGRRVRLSEVNVLEVVDNGSLFVGSSEEERLFVAVRRMPRLGESTGGAEEQAQQGGQSFQEGQAVDVSGALRPVPETADEALRRFGLEGDQFERLQEEQVFIRAIRVEAVGGGG